MNSYLYSILQDHRFHVIPVSKKKKENNPDYRHYCFIFLAVMATEVSKQRCKVESLTLT